MQMMTNSQPRETSGAVTIGGSVMAGFAAFSLWHMRVEERMAVRQEVRKRLSIFTGGSPAAGDDANGDEEAYYPHERQGSGVGK